MGAIYTQTGMPDGKYNFVHNRFMPALKAIGLFDLIQLSDLLTTDFELLNGFYNQLVFESADTLSTYSFRTGFQTAQYSIQAVIWLIQFVVQLVLSIPIYLLIKNFFTEEVFARSAAGKDSSAGYNNPVNSSLGIAIGFLSALLLFLPAILSFTQVWGASAEGVQAVNSLPIDKAFATYIPITLLGVIINAVVTALLAYPLTVRGLPGRGVYKVFLIIIFQEISARYF